MKRYRIKLINTENGKSTLTDFSYSDREEAENWCEAWRSLGKPYGAEVIDTKKEKSC